MDKPLFDSDVDPKRIRRVADGLRRQGEFESARMLDAYADRIETREKAVPFAFTAQFEDGGFSGIWKDINDVVNWHQPPIPLYTHPAPADAERLAEALRAKIKEWRGAYHHVTEFDRGRRNGFLAACDSLERLLSTHPAQAQPLACNELPGMWSHSDFIGGDPDERSYAERTAQPPADQILDGVDIDFAESFERKEQPPAARVPDWTDAQCVAFMAVGLRHTEYKKGKSPTVEEIRQGAKAALAAQENPNGL